MTTVGVREAAAQLPALLKRVAEGEQFLITEHGKPVARLTSAAAPDWRNTAEVVAQLKVLRRGTTLGGIPWKELRDAGRR